MTCGPSRRRPEETPRVQLVHRNHKTSAPTVACDTQNGGQPMSNDEFNPAKTGSKRLRRGHVIGGQRLWDRPQIVQLPQTVADASVHAEDLLVNETRDWEPVERTLYQLVHLWAELEAEQPRAPQASVEYGQVILGAAVTPCSPVHRSYKMLKSIGVLSKHAFGNSAGHGCS